MPSQDTRTPVARPKWNGCLKRDIGWRHTNEYDREVYQQNELARQQLGLPPSDHSRLRSASTGGPQPQAALPRRQQQQQQAQYRRHHDPNDDPYAGAYVLDEDDRWGEFRQSQSHYAERG